MPALPGLHENLLKSNFNHKLTLVESFISLKKERTGPQLDGKDVRPVK